jgi:hypothetical protein
MKSMLKRKPTPAMVVAIVALIVALGGTAVAANTISSDDIVDGQVMTSDLHAGAVVPAKISRIPAVGLREQSDFPVNPNTPNLVTFDVESFDTRDMHAGSGFLVRVPIAGIYRVTGHVSWVGNASATLPDGTQCTISVAKGTPLDTESASTSEGECSAGNSIEVNRAVRLNGHGTLFMVITQDSNAAFTLDAAQDAIYLDVTWVGPAS